MKSELPVFRKSSSPEKSSEKSSKKSSKKIKKIKKLHKSKNSALKLIRRSTSILTPRNIRPLRNTEYEKLKWNKNIQYTE